MNTIVYGQLQLNINGSSINFPKAYVGPKSISLAVPASHALTGHGGFQAICYITPNVDGNNIKLKHGWSETGPYCSIDVDGAMHDESTVAGFLEYPTMSTYTMLTLNMNPNGTIQLIGNNDASLDRFRLKAIQVELDSIINATYIWKSIDYFDEIIGIQQIDWIPEISTGTINNNHIANAISANKPIVNNNGANGLKLRNAFYNVLEIQSNQSASLVTDISPININQVLVWDTVDMKDVTFRSLPAIGEYSLNILNSVIDEPEVEPTIVYVSGGSMDPPYYQFYSDSAGTKEIDGLYLSNKKYEFLRLGNANTHPFYISDVGFKQQSNTLTFSGDGNYSDGIVGSQSFVMDLNNYPTTSSIYYYCTSVSYTHLTLPTNREV